MPVCIVQLFEIVDVEKDDRRITGTFTGKRVLNIFINTVSVEKPRQGIMTVKKKILCSRAFKLILCFLSHQLNKKRDYEHGKIEKRKTKHELIRVRIQQKRSSDRSPEKEYDRRKLGEREKHTVFQAENDERKVRDKTSPQCAEAVQHAAHKEEHHKRQRFCRMGKVKRIFIDPAAGNQKRVDKAYNRIGERDCKKQKFTCEDIDDCHDKRYQRQRIIQDIKRKTSARRIRNDSRLYVVQKLPVFMRNTHFPHLPDSVLKLSGSGNHSVILSADSRKILIIRKAGLRSELFCKHRRRRRQAIKAERRCNALERMRGTECGSNIVVLPRGNEIFMRPVSQKPFHKPAHKLLMLQSAEHFIIITAYHGVKFANRHFSLRFPFPS